MPYCYHIFRYDSIEKALLYQEFNIFIPAALLIHIQIYSFGKEARRSRRITAAEIEALGCRKFNITSLD